MKAKKIIASDLIELGFHSSIKASYVMLPLWDQDETAACRLNLAPF